MAVCSGAELSVPSLFAAGGSRYTAPGSSGRVVMTDAANTAGQRQNVRAHSEIFFTVGPLTGMRRFIELYNRLLGLIVERLVIVGAGATKSMQPQSSESRAVHRLSVCSTQSPYFSCRQLLVLRALSGPDQQGRLETLQRRLCLRGRFPRQ